MKNISQIPAEGIWQQANYGDAKVFGIACHCHCQDHNASMWVEKDNGLVAVTMYVDVKTAWWKDRCYGIDWLPYNAKYWINRIINSLSLIYHGVFYGYIQYNTDIILNKQSAINLSNVLVTAIDEVEQFETKHEKLDQCQKIIEDDFIIT